MNTQEIVIRDPYVLLHEGVYYLYGTRSATCWGKAEGFDCYCSPDLENWDGPFEIFRRHPDFFADRSFWAPECYAWQGRFYLVATLGAEDRKKGIYILTAGSPLGPFALLSGTPLTPPDWTCIDGSLFFDKKPYLLFSRSFEDNPQGQMYAVELTSDLIHAAAAPRLLFAAPDAPWAKPVPFAKEEFHMDGDVYFTDGPCVHRMADGSLCMLWSSWSDRGYAVGTARSESGSIYGPWDHAEEKFFPENGGHGMLFRDREGGLRYALHHPNDFGKEHPVFLNVAESGQELRHVQASH